MIEIKKVNLTDDVSERLIELSKIWVEEDCSTGMVVNTKDNLKEPCYAAYDKDKIIGYIFGHYYQKENKKDKRIEEYFDVDELYVLKEYRSQSIGNKLFKALEEEVSEKADYITLVTSTKDYQKILKFYIDDMGMSFHNAYLTKKLKNKNLGG